MIRSFLAIEIPQKQIESLAGYLEDLKKVPSKIKWVVPHQVHLTLKFFGSLSQETIDRISQALVKKVSDYPPFTLSLKGIGAFPNLFRPRVIWLGLGGEIETLQMVSKGIEQSLFSIGIPREERPFHPHLTLGRNKLNQVNEPLYRLLAQWPKEETTSFSIEEVVLFRSDLKPGGPVYTKLAVFPLNQGH